jgi:hypothetical protein
MVECQSNWCRDGLCTALHKCARLTNGQSMRNDLGNDQANHENVSKAGKPPMKQFKNSVLTCEMMLAIF